MTNSPICKSPLIVGSHLLFLYAIVGSLFCLLSNLILEQSSSASLIRDTAKTKTKGIIAVTGDIGDIWGMQFNIADIKK